jgi:outer membrane cobalamin receptor
MQNFLIVLTREASMDIARFVVMVGSFYLILGSYAPVALRAQTPSPTTQGQPSAGTTQTLEPIVVTGRADDLTGIAGSASEGRVGQAQLETRPFLRPGEVLEVVPGVIVTQHSGTGKANQYFLRGFNLDHGTDFSSFVDGIPVNFPTHAHGQGYMDLHWVIPELIDYVTFRRGRTMRMSAIFPLPARRLFTSSRLSQKVSPKLA